jgi:hypothetical protein
LISTCREAAARIVQKGREAVPDPLSEHLVLSGANTACSNDTRTRLTAPS